MKLNIWINSCFHVSLCAGLLTYASADFFQVKSSVTYALLAFFGTWCVYTAQRLFKGQRLGLTQVHEHIIRHKRIYRLIAVVCGLIAAGIASLSGLITVLLTAIGFLAAVAYVYFPGKKKSLRSMPIVKLILVATVWTLISLLLPTLPFYEDVNTQQLLYASLERFLFILMITIPFDVRDMLRDGPKEQTLPSILGEGKTKFLIALIFAGVMFFLYLAWLNFWYSDIQALALSGSYLIAFILSIAAKTKYPEQYFTLGIDSTLLLVAVALLSENFI